MQSKARSTAWSDPSAPSGAHNVPPAIRTLQPGTRRSCSGAAAPAAAPRNGPRRRPHLHHSPVRIVSHDHPARVTRQPPRRLAETWPALLQHRLPGQRRIARTAASTWTTTWYALRRSRDRALMQCRSVSSASASACCCGRVGFLRGGVARRRPPPWFGAAGTASRGRRRGRAEERAGLRGQAPAHHHRAVLLLVDVHRPARVSARGLARVSLHVEAPPSPHEALHVSRRARAPHRQQARLGLRGCDAGQRAHLGIGELAPRQGVGQRGQRAERAGDPDALTRGAQVEADAPRQPLRAGAEAGLPAPARIELPDER